MTTQGGDWSEFPELASPGGSTDDGLTLERTARSLETTAVALGRAIERVSEVARVQRDQVTAAEVQAVARAEAEERRLDRLERALRETLSATVQAQEQGAQAVARTLLSSIEALRLPAPSVEVAPAAVHVDLAPVLEELRRVADEVAQTRHAIVAATTGLATAMQEAAERIASASARPREVVHRVEREGVDGRIVRLRTSVSETG